VADIPGVMGDACAPEGVHGHGISSGGVPAVGGGAPAGSEVASGSVVALGGVVLEAGPVPPLAAIVPVVPAVGGGIVGANPIFPNNNPVLVSAAGGGALGAAIVPAPALAVSQLGHANPPPEGHHIIQIPYFDLCYSSGDEERNLPVLPNIKIKIEPGTE